jgi:clathrin heavy chain
MEVVEELVDHARVVNQLRRTGDWALQVGQAYMKAVQKNNVSAVNEALNELYIEDEDYTSLRESIDNFQNFNMIALASKLSTHELLEFRRISAYVYRCNKKWSLSIELSKNDRMWKDVIDTSNESEDAEIIEDVLRFFCNAGEKECFSAALYTCFTHVSPDVALELSWTNGYHNFIMPYMIQTFRNTHVRLQELEDKVAPPKDEETNQDQIAATYAAGGMQMNPGILMIEGPGMGGGMPPGMPGMNGGGQYDMYGMAPQMSNGMPPPGIGMMPSM